MSFVWSEIRQGVKEQGGSNPHQEIPDFLQVVNNAKNGHGLHTRAI